MNYVKSHNPQNQDANMSAENGSMPDAEAQKMDLENDAHNLTEMTGNQKPIGNFSKEDDI